MVNPFAASLFIILKLATTVEAKDFGSHGTTYPITEEDPIALIQSKLKEMEKNGELERHNKELQQKTKVTVERPSPVQGIRRASKSRTFYYDPSYTVTHDITDHTGKIIAQKGSKVNPLETVNLPYSLLFFDGDDEEQREWAKEQLQQRSAKLILVKGKPLSLAEEWEIPVYFDQGGILAKKLGIKHVPALITQERMDLRIEEISMGPPSQQEGP